MLHVLWVLVPSRQDPIAGKGDAIDVDDARHGGGTIAGESGHESRPGDHDPKTPDSAASYLATERSRTCSHDRRACFTYGSRKDTKRVRKEVMGYSILMLYLGYCAKKPSQVQFVPYHQKPSPLPDSSSLKHQVSSPLLRRKIKSNALLPVGQSSVVMPVLRPDFGQRPVHAQEWALMVSGELSRTQGVVANTERNVWWN